MAYLIPRDYQVNIQDVNLAQIISNDESIRNRAQLAGEAEAQSYLKQMYDISREFRDTHIFSIKRVYFGYDRVYLDAPTYNEADTYNYPDLVTYQTKVYLSNSTTTGIFDPLAWDLLGNQYDIYSAIPPKQPFVFSALYNIGDLVFWNKNIYRCRVQTSLLDHDTALQYRDIQSLPLNNVAPDDTIRGVSYWDFVNEYKFVGETPNQATFWELGDNRDAQMVLYCCDLVLYHLHSRIAPRNIPELRVKRYDDAKEWLKMCAVGDITPNLPLIQPLQGNRIRYGGNIKQINSY